jgi:acetyl esterase
MPDAHPARHDLVLESDVAYVPSPRGAKQDRAHLLDIYIPTRTRGPLPVVMYVHGGAFVMLSKDTHRVMALAIAKRGYVVFNINYRLGHRFPAPFEDACAALHWVAAHAASYGGDPSRIALAGESAGGNLVTALALAHATKRPEPSAARLFEQNLGLRAVVATYPFLDLTDVPRMLTHPRMSGWTKDILRASANSYLGSDWSPRTHAGSLANPLLLLENPPPLARPLPPFFTGAGTKDPLLRQSRRLKTALDALGVPCELLIAPGEIHGYDAMVWRPAARERWTRVHDFLARHLAPLAAPGQAPAASSVRLTDADGTDGARDEPDEGTG